jgi:hypothetical protein
MKKRKNNISHEIYLSNKKEINIFIKKKKEKYISSNS